VQPFDDFVRRADHAMVVVTVGVRDQLHGCLVGFHTQVSIEPRRYAVCLSHANATYRAAGEADALGVHLLAVADRELGSLFGETTADDGVDKFERCEWQLHAAGPPVLERTQAWFVGRIVDRVPMGDHTAHVLDPIEAGVRDAAPPLRLDEAEDFDAGH
jgi:flavin reductase (DIM6/NTAB) family NADH-FMN oxidoreductase RutF